MELVVLYGPPAVGKLTVARELSKLTGYKVFHNHLSIDLVEGALEFGTKEFSEIVDRYRAELIEAAAKHGTKGMIFTFVYNRAKNDDGFLRRISRPVKRYGGHIHFVQLTTGVGTLEGRLKGESRRRYNKVKTVVNLHKMLNRYDLFQQVGFAPSLRIDNTRISAKRAATMIVAHYKLGR